MSERLLQLRDVSTLGKKSPSGILQNLRVIQREVFEILSIPQLDIEVPDDGVNYLVVGQSGSGKSIFLRTMYALGRGFNQFEVPGNTPCFVSGSVTPIGNFRMTLGDEYGSQIKVNQFDASIGDSGPVVDFRIMHDELGLSVHRRMNKLVVFICRGKVIYVGPMQGLWDSDNIDIKKYTQALDKNLGSRYI